MSSPPCGPPRHPFLKVETLEIPIYEPRPCPSIGRDLPIAISLLGPVRLERGFNTTYPILWRLLRGRRPLAQGVEYVRPVSWSLKLFIALLAVQIVTQTAAYMTIIPSDDPWDGVLLTLLVWVPLNAAMEQLLWVYIFDAFETRWTERRARFIGGLVGMFLSIVFVGIIHVLFWAEFLPSFESVSPWSQIFLASQFIITPGYLLLYRRTGSMWPLFLIHIVSDATLVLSGTSSIWPYLWTP